LATILHPWPEFLGLRKKKEDFPDSPVVKTSPPNAGDASLIPGWGTKIPHTAGQLSLNAATNMPQQSQINIFLKRIFWL
jgi:hypothetical protein